MTQAAHDPMNTYFDLGGNEIIKNKTREIEDRSGDKEEQTEEEETKKDKEEEEERGTLHSSDGFGFSSDAGFEFLISFLSKNLDIHTTMYTQLRQTWSLRRRISSRKRNKFPFQGRRVPANSIKPNPITDKTYLNLLEPDFTRHLNTPDLLNQDP